LAHDALAVLLDDDRRRVVRIDVQGIIADAHHLFEVLADQPVVLDQMADFPRREGVEVAHDDGRPDMPKKREQATRASAACTASKMRRCSATRLDSHTQPGPQ
jgi:hypothetical protein